MSLLTSCSGHAYAPFRTMGHSRNTESFHGSLLFIGLRNKYSHDHEVVKPKASREEQARNHE